MGHVDYSFRCCRAGFNVLKKPFDIENSNLYINLQSENYQGASSLRQKSKLNPSGIIEIKKRCIEMERIYIPYNENFGTLESPTISPKIESSNVPQAKRTVNKSLYRKANPKFYPERGIMGFIGFLFRRFYNMSIDLRLFFIPKTIKSIGKFFNKLGFDLMNIEQ